MLFCAAFLVIVSFMDNRTLYCASENLYTSLQEVTAFCVITGIEKLPWYAMAVVSQL